MNYREIGDDCDIFPSQEDRREEEIARRLMRRVNDNFQIVVPFRSVETHVLNNFQSAKRRLENQQNSIIHDENRSSKYIEKIKRLKDMNYIKKVNTDNFEQNGSMWYLPHFATAQAKFHVAYDGAAQMSQYIDQ